MKPFTIERPWGSFRQFTKNEPTTVKILFVRDGEALSLQHHKERSEFWRVLSGTPDIQKGKAVIHAKAGDEFFIDVGESHRITAIGGDATCLEISTGSFNEDDIVREEDNYGRA
ncbi:MAG: phosphomannose isomerase type II C-terminal cupin domain [Patescibacteria group bacterium]